jgi:molybdopterin/thiamine biosynthesis adenylyltransferase
MRACLPESLLANVFLSSKVKDCIMIFKWVLANARYFSSVSILGQEEYEEDGSPDLSTIKPLVDGGTEGFKGHARVIIPGITPCFHCSLWLFPPQITFPLCTLAETPRSPAHCIEYAHLIQWGQDRIGEYFDADNPEHMKWIYDQVPLCNSKTIPLLELLYFCNRIFVEYSLGIEIYWGPFAQASLGT